MKILIVDDNILNQEVLSEMLKLLNCKFHITCVDNAQEVLKIQNLYEFDMILCDIEMPEIDGYMLYDILLKEKEYKGPIIAVSALAIQGDKEKILLYGFNEYISKPIELKVLQTVIQPYYEQLSLN